MMQVMRDIGGIELPDSLVKLGGDAAHGSPAATASTNGPAAVVKEKEKGKA
jgi:hypothetical protein